MLLNQLRCKDGDPENLLRNSFYQFQADRAITDLERQMKVLQEERDAIHIEEEDSLENYYSLLEQYKNLKMDAYTLGLEAEVAKLKEINHELLKKQACNCNFNHHYHVHELFECLLLTCCVTARRDDGE
ncbi:DExH-box ATP-dependent RNA helicase DExH9-like [Helianthus annuus]|uniref:DExH-box ATP-dependent RNA helicase DExH9-like n=1 Tax=Helianthus annuus TaxID=4232 RepID=UPI001652DDB9|nr:DExH-box ATP-dependent RNA helicase DExH9-like [Helianthus annuus]XP_035842474.1 DExH-box ATP-dependent RNA helicase DExH9-like [Helianthus annuus]